MGILGLLATFLVVAGVMGFGFAATIAAHDRVTWGLELEERVTAFRVWIQRGTSEVLGSILDLPATDPEFFRGDRVRARTELEGIRALVAGDPQQLVRVDELSSILERRFADEDAALEAARTGGVDAARSALAAGNWLPDRLRVRVVTSTMLGQARREIDARAVEYAATMTRLRVTMAVALLLMAGTLLYLLRQLRAAREARQEALRANDLARQRLADLEGVLDTVPAAVLIAHDPACMRVTGNRFAEALFRAPSEGANLSLGAPEGKRLPGLRILRNGVELVPDEMPLQETARTGVPVEGVAFDAVFADGTTRHVVGAARPLRDPAGALRGVVGAFVDVTDTVEVAHRLLAALDENRSLLATARRNELLYREMARSFPNGAIALFDHDLRFLIFDGTRFAIPRDAATNVGRTLAEIFPPEVVARIEPVHREALQGRSGRVETVVNGRDLEIRASPVRDETGAVLMGIATSQDVTEERALRSQLAVSSRLAAMGTLVAGVAHEVNNPLAGTLASLSSAIAELRDLAGQVREGRAADRDALAGQLDEVVEVLLDAQVGGNRISRIVRDLALFGRPNPMRTEVRLGDVVTSAMRWIPASVGQFATVHVDDLGSPPVRASAGQIEQVVVNLVTNAAFAIPEGRRGRVDVRISTSPRGRAVLEVQDDGRGIDPVTLERIFDPFFTTREVGSGMGLGLPICHAIVAAHGGTLTVRSTPGTGSTFRVELPQDSHQESSAPAARV